MTDQGLLVMPIYLTIAFVANVLFLYRAIGDNLNVRRQDDDKQGQARLLLFMALGELCWVLPCACQCWVVYADDNESKWVPKERSDGCDLQGAYSVFSATFGQTYGVLTAWATFSLVRGIGVSGNTVSLLSALMFVGAALVALLPVDGWTDVGNYVYTGEGFCYFDWGDTTHLIITLIISVGALAAASVLYYRCTLHYEQWKWPLMFGLAFVSGWFMWPIAGFIGLAALEQPDGIFITGAVMGHAQAMVNPILFGIYWRELFMNTDVKDAECCETSLQKMPGDTTVKADEETALLREGAVAKAVVLGKTTEAAPKEEAAPKAAAGVQEEATEVVPTAGEAAIDSL